MSDLPRRTLVIAEAGVNHNGSIARALEMVDEAASAGADVIKFQTFDAKRLVVRSAPKAEYQLRSTNTTESQLDMLKSLELPREAHRALLKRCAERNISFLSTPFDETSLAMLVSDLGVRRLKIGSGDATNAPLLLAAARTRLPIVLSTGMCGLGDVERALGVLALGYAASSTPPSRAAFLAAFGSADGQRALRENVVLLHCTTEYPAPISDVNLRAMDTLACAFSLPVGYSDHTDGITVAIAAAARGAAIIEKHFTLDRSLSGPDHAASLDPSGLKLMIESVRDACLALGSATKAPAPSELKNVDIARRSLVAARAIRKGEVFSEDTLTVKRPGTGRSPYDYWDLLGRVADRDYEPDSPI